MLYSSCLAMECSPQHAVPSGPPIPPRCAALLAGLGPRHQRLRDGAGRTHRHAGFLHKWVDLVHECMSSAAATAGGCGLPPARRRRAAAARRSRRGDRLRFCSASSPFLPTFARPPAAPTRLAPPAFLVHHPTPPPCAVYLCKYFTLEGYCTMTGCSTATSYGGLPYYYYGGGDFNSGHLNAFDYWSGWTTDMKAGGGEVGSAGCRQGQQRAAGGAVVCCAVLYSAVLPRAVRPACVRQTSCAAWLRHSSGRGRGRRGGARCWRDVPTSLRSLPLPSPG